MKARSVERDTQRAMIELFYAGALAYVPIPALNQAHYEQLLYQAQAQFDAIIKQAQEIANESNAHTDA